MGAAIAPPSTQKAAAVTLHLALPLPLRTLLLAGVAAVAISGCASNRVAMVAPDFSSQSPTQQSALVSQLAQKYRSNPRDKATLIYYSAALRSAGQADQAASVLENGIATYPDDVDIKVAYAKALASSGRFDQALNVIEDAIDPAAPDWSALLVKGAILDQSGRNQEARAVYQQALLTAPNQPALEANLGLSYAMTNDLQQAEAHLRKASKMPGATSQIRQNLALVVGLQGRFAEAKTILAADLPPDQVDANMVYIKSMITQQNRWDLIKQTG